MREDRSSGNFPGTASHEHSEVGGNEPSSARRELDRQLGGTQHLKVSSSSASGVQAAFVLTRDGSPEGMAKLGHSVVWQRENLFPLNAPGRVLVSCGSCVQRARLRKRHCGSVDQRRVGQDGSRVVRDIHAQGACVRVDGVAPCNYPRTT